MDPLITVADLAGDLEEISLLDIRWELSGPPGRPAYEAGHIPGACFIDLDTDLAGPPGAAGRHPLPDLAVFTAAMRRAGISADRDVVVYDGGLGWAAARAWWLLRWAGHDRVRVLDGGLPAWTAAGHPLVTAGATPADGTFTPAPDALPVLTTAEAASLARRGLLLDARAVERYRGDIEPIDRVGGHIPGAISAPTTENVANDGVFLSAAALADRFFKLGADRDTEVGVYCGSGVSAAHQVLALAIAGIPAALYPGSWSEWSSDPGRPIVVGPHPG